MSPKGYVAISVLVCATVGLGLVFAQTIAPGTGQWTISSSLVDDRVQLTIQRNNGINSNMSSSSSMQLNQLRGLTRAQLDSTGSAAAFELVRDAGTFHFQGFVQSGSGGGTMTFTANPNFSAEIRALGYSGVTDDNIFVLAVHDVSATYIRDLTAAGVRPDSLDQVLTMRIHNVTVEYVRELQSLGYAELSADKLVTMRIHGVSPDFARELKGMGYNSVSTDQLVTMRIHGVSTDFMKEIEGLGYNHPGIDQFVTMRIHGITPDYIRKARERGLQNLSIDQLVGMKIHGVLE